MAYGPYYWKRMVTIPRSRVDTIGHASRNKGMILATRRKAMDASPSARQVLPINGFMVLNGTVWRAYYRHSQLD